MKAEGGDGKFGADTASRGVIKEERSNRLPPAPVAALLPPPSCQAPPGTPGHPAGPSRLRPCPGLAPGGGHLPPGMSPVPVGGSLCPPVAARPYAMG